MLMNNKNFVLAYHTNNKATAQKIDSDLSRVGYTFEHLECDDQMGDAPLTKQILRLNTPVILLVSDNFLKAGNCMQNGLQMLQGLSSENRLLPLVIEGEYTDAETGLKEVVPTHFERVSDVIQYMNFWQNRYLDLRKEKRELPHADEEAFNEHLRIVRGISSEIGEFLRQLRVIPNYTLEEFSNNAYELFFRFSNDLNSHGEYQALAALTASPSTPSLTAEVEKPNTPEEAPALESQEEAPEEEYLPVDEEPNASEADEGTIAPDETETLEEDTIIPVEEIPGINLLESASSPETPEGGAPFIYDESSTDAGHTPDSGSDEPSGEDFHEIDDFVEESSPIEDMPLLDKVIQYEEDRKKQEEEEEEEEEEEQEDQRSEESLSFEWEKEEIEERSHQDRVDELFEDDDDEIEQEQTSNHKQAIADQLIEQSNEMFEDGDIPSGLNTLMVGIESNPDNPILHYQYALALLKHQNNLDEAKEHLQKVIDLEPANEQAIFLLGELAELKGQFHEARGHYTEVASLNEDFPGVYYRLGVLIAQNFPSEGKKASKYFKRAIKQDKRNADAHYQYAVLLNEQLGKTDKAIKHFGKTLKYQPDHPFANYDLAMIFHRLGEIQSAKEYYLRSTVINPELKTRVNDEAFQLIEPAVLEPEEEGSHQQVQEEVLEASKEPADPKGVVLITGATSGIGKATAAVFAQAGYALILTGRREDRLREIGQNLGATFEVPIHTLSFDVREPMAANQVVEQLPEEWQNIDILINNAGLAKGLAPIHEGNPEDWNTMIDTNIKGLLYMTRAISPFMVKRKHGHIINVCSTAGKEVYPMGNVYCATKYAVDALTKSMRLDLYKHQIRVSQVSPGHVEETEFARVRFDDDQERAKIYEDFNPLTAGDVAEAIYFIASRPAHVNIQDVLMMGTQQAGSTFIDRSGRKYDAPNPE
jgi:NADP-dependent 3-hydroxy acid dehydrogenase YdfG/Flp pilus assembly protein TadD